MSQMSGFLETQSVCMYVQYFRQVEAVRRIKGEECRYEVDRIEDECVSESALFVRLSPSLLFSG